MDKFVLARYLSFILLGVSIVIYVLTDPLYKLISFQGPLLAGALLGWYTLNSSTPKDKFIEFEDTMVPVTSFLLRRKSWIALAASIVLIAPWLTPGIFRLSLIYPEIYFVSFISDFIGGFIAGYFISSLRFVEKIILYSLALVVDIFYVILLYIYSILYGISQASLLDHVIIYAYSVKFLEGVIFIVYIIKKINLI